MSDWKWKSNSHFIFIFELFPAHYMTEFKGSFHLGKMMARENGVIGLPRGHLTTSLGPPGTPLQAALISQLSTQVHGHAALNVKWTKEKRKKVLTRILDEYFHTFDVFTCVVLGYWRLPCKSVCQIPWIVNFTITRGDVEFGLPFGSTAHQPVGVLPEAGAEYLNRRAERLIIQAMQWCSVAYLSEHLWVSSNSFNRVTKSRHHSFIPWLLEVKFQWRIKKALKCLM